MPLRIYQVTPSHQAVAVRLSPAIVRVEFEGDPDRDSLQRAVSITPNPPGAIYFRWTQHLRKDLSAQRDLSSRRPSAGFVAAAVMEVLCEGGWAPQTTYTLTLDASVAVGTDGSRLPASWTGQFSTREDAVHIRPPAVQRRALVLAGGGAKGAFQAGVVKYLYEQEKFFPDVLVGSSAGALNTVVLAHAESPEEHLTWKDRLLLMWRAIRLDSQIFSMEPVLSIPNSISDLLSDLQRFQGSAISNFFDRVNDILMGVDNLRMRGGLLDVKPLRDNFLRNVIDAGKIRRNQKVKWNVGAVDLYTGRLDYFDNNCPDPVAANGDIVDPDLRAILTAVLASAAIPVAFTPQQSGKAVYTDSGIRELAGLKRALELGATDIVVVPAAPVQGWIGREPRGGERRYQDVVAVAQRALTDLAFDEILSNDLQTMIDEQRLKNRYLGKDVRIRVVDPLVETHSSLDFHPEAIRRSIDYGERRAAEVLGNWRASLPPHPVGVTRTALRLVVRPLHPDGTIIRDHRCFRMFDGGVGCPANKEDVPDVRIIIKEGSAVVGLYPNDLLWSYPSITVPGTDTALELLPVNPRLPVERDGQFYAIPLSRGGSYSVEVLVSGRDHPSRRYCEERYQVSANFTPNDQGYMVLDVPTAWPEGRRASRSARVYMDTVGNPPCITFHGECDVPDMELLTGCDGTFKDAAGKVLGRWESSRMMADMRIVDSAILKLPPNARPTERLVLKGAEAIHFPATGSYVTVFREPNFAGERVDLHGPKGDVGFPIRSFRVFAVVASGGA
jgi:NTE family protein